MNIKPTVGRIVWYWPKAEDQLLGYGSGQPLAAQIAFVHSDTLVNIGGLDASGAPFWRQSVYLREENGPLPPEGYCEWMPYQKGQAAKTEAVEAQLSSAGQVVAEGYGTDNAKLPSDAA